jgi:hypothetical protein
MKKQTEQQTQRTPKGTVVPVPKRDDFLGNLKKAITPDKKSEKRGPAK